MGGRKIIGGIGAAVGMLVLILDSKTALAGAAQGLELCLRTVIPSLFPFILLSNLLTGALSGMSFSLLRPAAKLFGIPKGAESLLLPAFLGGYPVGAQCIGAAHVSGQLSKEDAERLLTFCSNAGPSFLFGITGAMLPSFWMPWALWGIQILSALLVSVLFSCRAAASTAKLKPKENQSVMSSAVSVMGSVCGWVIIFRVLIAFLDRWILWLLPVEGKVAVMGILELSNGCCALGEIESIPLRFVLCSGLLSFGGLCVTMQTISVTQGLSIRNYLIGKGLQSLFSLLLSLSVLGNITAAAAISCIAIAAFTQKMRKKSRNPLPVGV